MELLPLYCPDCDTTTGHTVAGAEAACTGCGSVREVDADQIAGVVDMQRCPRCRWTHPVDQTCDPTPCLRQTGLWPCGRCEACYAAQEADLARRAEFEHDPPSDIDHPGMGRSA